MSDWDSQEDRLIPDLLTGAIDNSTLHFIAGLEDGSCVTEEEFIGFIETHRKTHTDCSDQPNSNESSTTCPLRYPNKKIVQFFAQHFLVDHLFAYVSRFSRTNPGELARAYECLAAGPFLEKTDIIHQPVEWERYCNFYSRQFNFFRLAQRIRDESGTGRENSPPMCFRSFEDITQLERVMEDILIPQLQFIALRIVDERHFATMYYTLPNRSRMLQLHEALVRIGSISENHSEIHEKGFELRGLERPSWHELKEFLRTHECFRGYGHSMFKAQIADVELNEALNLFLNFLVRMLRGCSKLVGYLLCGTVGRLEEFLARGASLYFKDLDGELSSLGALARLLKIAYFVDSKQLFWLRDLSEYMCCPVRDHERKMVFDNRRIAPLSCLSARKVDSLDIARELPLDLSSLIEAHRELRWEVQREFSFEDYGARDAEFPRPRERSLGLSYGIESLF